MSYLDGLISCIPIIVLVILVMKTRRMTESMFISSVIACVLAYKTGFITGYVSMLYAALSDSSYQLLLLVGGGFGGLIALLEKSGSMYGFRKTLVKYCNSPKKTMVLTWILGGIVFIDDYLNALAVAVSMKGISDHFRIPREHLAYTINCMGACVCVLIPVSSWSAFAIGNLAEYGLGAADYYRAVRFMFYPFCCLIISLLLAVRKFPLMGSMKKAYDRVEAGGPVLPEHCAVEDMAHPDEETEKQASIWDFLLPMAALFAGTLLFANSIVIGMLFAILVMFLIWVFRKKRSATEFTDVFVGGVMDMIPLLFTILLGFAMQSAVSKMGFSVFVTELCSNNVPAQLVPAIAFLLVGGAAFMAASFWLLIVITFPIFIPLAMHMGIDPCLIIGAIMSGVALGSQACIFSDAIFMVASGTGVTNDDQFRSILPYVGIGAAAAFLMFLAAGLLM